MEVSQRYKEYRRDDVVGRELNGAASGNLYTALRMGRGTTSNEREKGVIADQGHFL